MKLQGAPTVRSFLLSVSEIVTTTATTTSTVKARTDEHEKLLALHGRAITLRHSLFAVAIVVGTVMFHAAKAHFGF